ncbi:MAG: preprotein translocase subunit SecE [Candidatus Margulisbacteria bacterium]|nr:preprotein translocase subunit SecE [Candidatus Margulisiibacteriota bacterium]
MKNKIQNYLKETLAEMKKVVWPDRRYITVATVIILILVIATALFVMGVDSVFAWLFKTLLR